MECTHVPTDANAENHTHVRDGKPCCLDCAEKHDQRQLTLDFPFTLEREEHRHGVNW